MTFTHIFSIGAVLVILILPVNLHQPTYEYIDTKATLMAPLDIREFYAFATFELSDKTKVRVKTSKYADLAVGQIVKLNGQLEEPSVSEDFDYKKYLSTFGITALMDYPKIEIVGLNNSAKYWLLKNLAVLRQNFEAKINRLLPEPEASFLAGLLIGSRRAIPESTLDELARTGTTHIIAVSGANVVIVASVILILFRYLTNSTRASFWLAQFVIFSFVVLTGLSAAAVRGGVVSSLTLWAKSSGRPTNIWGLLFVPAAIMLGLNSFYKFDIGWQLSFAAFTGIILLPDWLEQKTNSFAPAQILPEIVKKPLLETVAATTFVTPIAIYHFGTFSASAFLANPLVLWIIPIAMAVGFCATVIYSAVPFLLIPLRIIATIPLNLILLIIHLVAKIPWTFFEF